MRRLKKITYRERYGQQNAQHRLVSNCRESEVRGTAAHSSNLFCDVRSNPIGRGLIEISDNNQTAQDSNYGVPGAVR